MQYWSHSIGVSNARYNVASPQAVNASWIKGAYRRWTSRRSLSSQRAKRRWTLCACKARLIVEGIQPVRRIELDKISPTIIFTAVFRCRWSCHWPRSSRVSNPWYNTVALVIATPLGVHIQGGAFVPYPEHFVSPQGTRRWKTKILISMAATLVRRFSLEGGSPWYKPPSLDVASSGGGSIRLR